MLRTISRNFCLPSSQSSMMLDPCLQSRTFSGSLCEQLLNFLNNDLPPGQIHISNALPADDAALIDHIDVRNRFSASVELVGSLPGIQQVGLGHLRGECAEERS